MSLLALPIRTRRLLLRPFEPVDFPTFADMHSRPEVVRYLYWEPRSTRASREAFARKSDPATFAGDSTGFSLAVTAVGNVFVGDVSLFQLDRNHRSAEVGFIFHPDQHGRGYAHEAARALIDAAFTTFGLHRVYGRCDGRNTASARLMRKLGMRQEAHFVQNEFVKGEWTDELIFAVLASEWRGAATGG